jgi:cbb3-type cytochrome oxidase maturation protein
MSIIYVLIPLSMLFLSLFIVSFFWAVNNDQYDEFEVHAHHIILNEKNTRSKNVNIN